MFFLLFSTGVKQPWADLNGYDSLDSANDDELSAASEEEGSNEPRMDPLEGDQINDGTEHFQMKGL